MNDFIDAWVKIIEADQQNIEEGFRSAFEEAEVEDGQSEIGPLGKAESQ